MNCYIVNNQQNENKKSICIPETKQMHCIDSLRECLLPITYIMLRCLDGKRQELEFFLENCQPSQFQAKVCL